MIEMEEEKTIRVQVEKSGGSEDCQGSHMEEEKTVRVYMEEEKTVCV